MHLGARFYDPKLSLWTAPDTMVPKPSNPQSLDRYSYVYNRPTAYTDPSGHCGETDWTPEENQACQEWIDKIQNKYTHVSIVEALWNAKELELLWLALENHPFRDSIVAGSSGYDLVLRREVRDKSAGPYSDVFGDTKFTLDDTGRLATKITVRVYNLAWIGMPQGEGETTYWWGGWNRQDKNFLGTLAHELTHAAVAYNPGIINDWIEASSGHPNEPPTYGSRYPFDEDQAARDPTYRPGEYLAMAVAMYVAAPSAFTDVVPSYANGYMGSTGIPAPVYSYATDWRYSWLVTHTTHPNWH